MQIDPEKFLTMACIAFGVGLGAAFVVEINGNPMNWWDRLALASFIGGGLFLELYVHHFDKYLKRWD